MSNVVNLDIRGDYIYRDVPIAVLYDDDDQLWHWSCDTSQIYHYVNVPLLGSQRSRSLAIAAAQECIDAHFKHRDKAAKIRNVNNRGRYGDTGPPDSA